MLKMIMYLISLQFNIFQTRQEFSFVHMQNNHFKVLLNYYANNFIKALNHKQSQYSDITIDLFSFMVSGNILKLFWKTFQNI